MANRKMSGKGKGKGGKPKSPAKGGAAKKKTTESGDDLDRALAETLEAPPAVDPAKEAAEDADKIEADGEPPAKGTRGVSAFHGVMRDIQDLDRIQRLQRIKTQTIMGPTARRDRIREIETPKEWPEGEDLPTHYIKPRPVPCRNPECRRLRLDSGSQACIVTGYDGPRGLQAYFRCRVCRQSFSMRVAQPPMPKETK